MLVFSSDKPVHFQPSEPHEDDQGVLRGWYVYAHMPIGGGEKFYIGLGTGTRAWSRQRSADWQARVKALGGKFTIGILALNLSEKEAEQQEAEWIAKLAPKGHLVNRLPGADRTLGVSTDGIISEAVASNPSLSAMISRLGQLHDEAERRGLVAAPIEFDDLSIRDLERAELEKIAEEFESHCKTLEELSSAAARKARGHRDLEDLELAAEMLECEAYSIGFVEDFLAKRDSSEDFLRMLVQVLDGVNQTASDQLMSEESRARGSALWEYALNFVNHWIGRLTGKPTQD